MNHNTPNILLINPWVHDFAAYDFWAKPMGLLILASLLREHGFGVYYIDCLDRFHPRANWTDPNAGNGRGSYIKTRISKPKGLDDIPRNYSRYGIMEEWFREDLQSIPKPDLILITSMMTYWYSGVRNTISIIKDIFPHIPVVMGGIYATLYRDHAVRHCGADRVISGPGEANILSLVEEITGFSVSSGFDPDNLDTYPYPAFDLQRKITYIPLLTSRGCPFSCAYCASSIVSPKRMLRNPGTVVEEIKYWNEKYGTREFVLYDDALLVDPEKHAIPMLEKIIQTGLKVNFHTPNAVHVRGISGKIADLMYRAGFKTLRLGLETSVFESRSNLDGKVTEDEFIQAVSYLKKAGFERNQVGAYLLFGLPGQDISSVEESIETVKKRGITPILAYYTPIQGTAIWEKAIEGSRYELESDPIFTNNAIFPCWGKTFPEDTISRLKRLIKAPYPG